MTTLVKVYSLTTYDSSGDNRNNKGNSDRRIVTGGKALGKDMSKSGAIVLAGNCGFSLSKRCVIGTNSALGVNRNIAVDTGDSSTAVSCVLIRRKTGVRTMNATSTPVIVATSAGRPKT